MMACGGVKLAVEFDDSFSVDDGRRWIITGPIGGRFGRVVFNPHFTDAIEFLQEREL
jgi:hypothetical protein